MRYKLFTDLNELSIHLNGRDYSHTIFSELLLNDTQLTQCNLQDALFDFCTAPQINFAGSHLQRTIFRACHFAGANFTDCDLTEVIFTDCDLTEADFTGAKLIHANFTNSDLSEATLPHQIYDADLSRATTDRHIYTIAKPGEPRYNYDAQRNQLYVNGEITRLEHYIDQKAIDIKFATDPYLPETLQYLTQIQQHYDQPI